MNEQKKDNGGLAFPVVCQDLSKFQVFEGGMSLRDWFAGCAMQTLKVDPYSPSALAGAAYAVADAMLAARKS